MAKANTKRDQEKRNKQAKKEKLNTKTDKRKRQRENPKSSRARRLAERALKRQ